jgi:hypothetical protein
MPRFTDELPEDDWRPQPPGVARPIRRRRPDGDAARRLQRLRSFSWLLDSSIPIGRWRIGLDPILGLLPGVGDWAGAVASMYLLYEGARLGLPKHVLFRMAGNVLVETVVGGVPVVGDIFDAAWKANTRNLRLVEEHYQPRLTPRSLRSFGLVLLLFVVLVLAILAGMLYLTFRVIEVAFR